jgi:hypothetical protein
MDSPPLIVYLALPFRLFIIFLVVRGFLPALCVLLPAIPDIVYGVLITYLLYIMNKKIQKLGWIMYWLSIVQTTEL